MKKILLFSFLKRSNKKTMSKLVSGFTLVEALVAISILMIAIASPMTLAQKGLSTATLSKDQMIASFLAQDAIEAIRNVRDQIAVSQTNGGDWLGNSPLLSLSACVCDPRSSENCNFDSPTTPSNLKFCNIDTTASAWNNSSIMSGNINGNNLLKISYNIIASVKHFLKYDYNNTSSPSCSSASNGLCSDDSKFSRYINIIKDPTNTNTDEAVVNVRVSWPTPAGAQNIDIHDFIYNYSQNF